METRIYISRWKNEYIDKVQEITSNGSGSVKMRRLYMCLKRFGITRYDSLFPCLTKGCFHGLSVLAANTSRVILSKLT